MHIAIRVALWPNEECILEEAEDTPTDNHYSIQYAKIFTGKSVNINMYQIVKDIAPSILINKKNNILWMAEKNAEILI